MKKIKAFFVKFFTKDVDIKIYALLIAALSVFFINL